MQNLLKELLKLTQDTVGEDNVELMAYIQLLEEQTNYTWEDINGRSHKVHNMEHDHIGNALHMLIISRDKEEKLTEELGFPFEFQRDTSKKTSKWIKIFKAELLRRKLAIELNNENSVLDKVFDKGFNILNRASSTKALTEGNEED